MVTMYDMLCACFGSNVKGDVFTKFNFIHSVASPEHLKMTSGQCPAWGILEPQISSGKWVKFLNNDGQEVAVEAPSDKEQEFCQKSLSFAHWTFQHFGGRAVVCDLQGRYRLCRTIGYYIQSLLNMATMRSNNDSWWIPPYILRRQVLTFVWATWR